MRKFINYLSSKKTSYIILSVIVVILVVALFFATNKASSVTAVSSLREELRPRIVDHTEAFKAMNITRYEGSKTCIPCHKEAVIEVFRSLHYQMLNPVGDISGKDVVYAGSKVVYNDFCGAIFWNGEVPINFIGNATLKTPPPGYEKYKGKFIASGCSMCHGISLGLIPNMNLTNEQLENIDCLVCHSTKYKGGPIGIKEGWRVLVKINGSFRYVPNPELDIEDIASSITATPTKESCLYCHAFSGGGPGFKRPNIGPELMGRVDEEVDVHLAEGLECIDCHVADEHNYNLRSSDTWSRSEAKIVECEVCHEERHSSPVVGWFIETFHMDKVACQTCHIPVIASKTPTDVHRDWSKIEFNERLLRYEPSIELQGNVTPVYLWWNERDRLAYIYPEKADVTEDGELILSMPVGDKEDGKIYPYKYHEAVVPFDQGRGIPIPIKVGVVFATGNNTLAFILGGKPGNLEFTGNYITLIRYMAVNHGVKPADEALGCFDCHGIGDTRMDWEALGYGILPKIYFASVIIVIVGLIVFVSYYLWRLYASR